PRGNQRSLHSFPTRRSSDLVSWAETLLEQRINDIVRAEYGRRTSNQAISEDRSTMMQAIREEANNIGKDQGISDIDVRIQQITLDRKSTRLNSSHVKISYAV